MTDRLRRGLRYLVEPLATRLGYLRADASPHSKDALLRGFLGALRDRGFSPGVVADVGAHRGSWSGLAREFFPDARFVLFEPNPTLQPELRRRAEIDGGFEVIEAGVGERSGTATLHLHSRDDSASFTGWGGRIEAADRVECRIVSLDDAFADRDPPELLKVDAEGLDLEVLRGAGTLLPHTEVVLVEAAVASPHFSNRVLDVLRFMDDAGYDLSDITDLNRPFGPGLLWLVELAFVRRDGPLGAVSPGG